MSNKVSFKRVLLTEASAFFLLAFPAFFLFVALLIFGIKYYPLNSVSLMDFVNAFIVLVVSMFIFLSVAYWWYAVINKTLRLGCEIPAEINEKTESLIPLIGIKYTFEHGGKKYCHTADFVSNKRTREVASKTEIVVMFDVSKNRSFIKSAYMD